jgi:hypothetical protein
MTKRAKTHTFRCFGCGGVNDHAVSKHPLDDGRKVKDPAARARYNKLVVLTCPSCGFEDIGYVWEDGSVNLTKSPVRTMIHPLDKHVVGGFYRIHNGSSWVANLEERDAFNRPWIKAILVISWDENECIEYHEESEEEVEDLLQAKLSERAGIPVTLHYERTEEDVREGDSRSDDHSVRTLDIYTVRGQWGQEVANG